MHNRCCWTFKKHNSQNCTYPFLWLLASPLDDTVRILASPGGVLCSPQSHVGHEGHSRPPRYYFILRASPFPWFFHGNDISLHRRYLISSSFGSAHTGTLASLALLQDFRCLGVAALYPRLSTVGQLGVLGEVRQGTH